MGSDQKSRRPHNPQHVERLLSHYRDLTPGEQIQVQRHLASCARCRRTLEVFEGMDRHLGQSELHIPGRRLKDGFFTALDGERAEQGPLWGGIWSQASRFAVQLLGLALLVVMIAGLSLLIRQQVPDLAAIPGGTAATPTITPSASFLPDIKPLSLRLTLTEPGSSEILTLSEDGQFLAAAQGSQVQIWATVSGRLLETVDIGADQVVELAFSPDDTTLVVRTSAGQLQRWRVAGGARLSEDQSTPVVAPESLFTVDDLHLAVTTVDNQVELWELATGDLKTTISDSEGIITSLGFSKNGEMLLAGDSAGAVHLWDLDTYTESLLTGPQQPVVVLAISPPGDRIAAALADGQVLLWSLPDKTLLQILPPAEAKLLDMRFTTDGYTFFRLLQDGSLEHWTVGGAQPDGIRAAPALYRGEFAPFSWGLILAGITADGRVALWEKLD